MDGEGMQVLGEGEGAASLEAKAGTAGAATPLSHDEVRQVVDDALKAYGVATSGDVAGVADSAASAAAGKVAESDGTTQTVELSAAQYEDLKAYHSNGLAVSLCMLVLVGAVLGIELGKAIVKGWR